MHEREGEAAGPGLSNLFDDLRDPKKGGSPSLPVSLPLAPPKAATPRKAAKRSHSSTTGEKASKNHKAEGSINTAGQKVLFDDT